MAVAVVQASLRMRSQHCLPWRGRGGPQAPALEPSALQRSSPGFPCFCFSCHSAVRQSLHVQSWLTTDLSLRTGGMKGDLPGTAYSLSDPLSIPNTYKIQVQVGVFSREKTISDDSNNDSQVTTPKFFLEKSRITRFLALFLK